MSPTVWFKVDDSFADHPKVLTAGNGAIGLWVRAGAWSARHLTDGYVPNSVARLFGAPSEARRLVAAGLWLVEEDGYRFHEWGERQPDAASTKAKRDAESEAGQRGNHLRWHAARGIAVPDCEWCRVPDGVPIGEPESGANPPGPGPVEQQTTSVVGSDEAAAPKRKVKRATRRPDDFRPTEAHVALAAELGVDLRREWPKFIDHHDARGSSFKDWPAALRTWIRNSAEFAARRGTSKRGNDIDWTAAMEQARHLDEQMGQQE